MNIGSIAQKFGVEIKTTVVRETTREIETTTVKALAGLGQDALNLGARNGMVDAMAKMGIKAIDGASSWSAAASSGYAALDGILSTTASPVGRTLRKTAAAMSTNEDAAKVLRQGLVRSELLEGSMGLRGNVRGMAEVGTMAIDTASAWSSAATAGYHAVDGILDQGSSPVARTLRKTAAAMSTNEDAAKVLHRGLARPELLESSMGVQANVRSMADIGVMAIDTASAWSSAASAGYHTVDAILDQSASPVARSLRKTAAAMSTNEDAAKVLKQGLLRSDLLDGGLGTQGNVRAMASLGVMAIDSASSWSSAASAGYHALDSIMNEASNPALLTFRKLAAQQSTNEDAAKLLRTSLQSLL